MSALMGIPRPVMGPCSRTIDSGCANRPSEQLWGDVMSNSLLCTPAMGTSGIPTLSQNSVCSDAKVFTFKMTNDRKIVISVCYRRGYNLLTNLSVCPSMLWWHFWYSKIFFGLDETNWNISPEPHLFDVFIIISDWKELAQSFGCFESLGFNHVCHVSTVRPCLVSILFVTQLRMVIWVLPHW